MWRDGEVSKTLRELREQVAQEQDPSRLRDLVIEINSLLDIIEEQVTKLEERPPASRHKSASPHN